MVWPTQGSLFQEQALAFTASAHNSIMSSSYQRTVGGKLELKGGIQLTSSKKHRHRKKKKIKTEQDEQERLRLAGSSAEHDDSTDPAHTPSTLELVKRKGTGRILSSGTTLMSHMGSTKFLEELKPGDAIIIQHPTSFAEETRIVRMVLSDVSASISSAFSSDLISSTPFYYIKAPPSEEEDQIMTQALETKRKRDSTDENLAFGTYAGGTQAGSQYTYRVKKSGAYGGYAIIKEAADVNRSREDLLDLRAKKKATMGKKPSGGVNTKVEAANARKAAAKAQKDAQKQAMKDAQEEAEWAVGSDARGTKKREEEERKRAEAAAKKAELKKMQALEDHALAKVEDRAAIRKLKNNKKDASKPWEEALKPAVKKNNKGMKSTTTTTTTAAAAAPKKTTLFEIQKQQEKEAEQRAKEATKQAKAKGIQFVEETSLLQENRNRDMDVNAEARDIESAIHVLSVNDGTSGASTERHPERRAKAAYKAFEEFMLPQLKEEFPGLKLSQYKQKLSEMWRKSPQNPLNQETLAYNAKKA